jgi:adenosine deaminase
VDGPVDEGWVRGLPKAEVHLHLEGCVPPALVEAAARRQGVDLSAGPRLPVRDLPELLAYLDVACALVDRADDLSAIAYDTMARAAGAGTGHVDVICNPTHWPAWRGRLGALVDALDAGFRGAEEDGLGTAGLCLSIKRTQGAAEAMELVEWILASGPPGLSARRRVVALSVDGNEAGGTRSHTDRFAPAFARAAAGGLHRCAHAGESSGAQGVREAVDGLGAERIDHGIRCVEDPALVAELARRAVPLDVCPSSNVLLGVVPSLAEHPVEHLRAAGVRLSLNTDDPLLYGVDVPGEYLRCAGQFGWDRATVAAMARTSIDSCFADPDRRATLSADLDRYLTDGRVRGHRS